MRSDQGEGEVVVDVDGLFQDRGLECKARAGWAVIVDNTGRIWRLIGVCTLRRA